MVRPRLRLHSAGFLHLSSSSWYSFVYFLGEMGSESSGVCARLVKQRIVSLEGKRALLSYEIRLCTTMTDFLNKLLHSRSREEPQAIEEDEVVDDAVPEEPNSPVAEIKVETTVETSVQRSAAPVSRPSVPAKRHLKDGKLTDEQGVMRNWKPGRVSNLMKRAGIVSASSDSVVLCCHVLQGILQQGVNAGVVYAGLVDGRSRTLREDDVKLGFKHAVGLNLYS